MSAPQNLKGQIAIISGALGDIGRAIALELASRGADIALGDVREESDADAVLSALGDLDVGARYDRADVSNALAVSSWVENVAADLGTPTLIIPNAAIVTLKNIREVSPEEWNREMQINLNGAFHLAQACALRLLKEQREGRIVFIGSWAAHAPHTHIPTYCAAKAGLRMLMKCMALEFAPQGILVNEVAPGYVNAGLSGQVFDRNPQLKKESVERVPIQKLIEPEEVASQVAHLCDPSNRHMTGGVFLMDGGLSLKS